MPEQDKRTDSLSIVTRIAALFMVAALVVLFFAFTKPVGPSVKAQTTTTQQTVIGKDCQQCHRLVVQTFALDAHGKSAKFLKDSRGAKC